MLSKTDHEFHEQGQSGVETWQKENVTNAPAKLHNKGNFFLALLANYLNHLTVL